MPCAFSRFTGGHLGATPCVHVHLVHGQLLEHNPGGGGSGRQASTAIRTDGYPDWCFSALHSEHFWCDPVHPIDLGRRHSGSGLRLPPRPRLLLRGMYRVRERR